MPKTLNIPWEKIRSSVESGASLADVAKLFGISAKTVGQRSLREKWLTPRRIKSGLLKAAESKSDKIIVNQSLLEQLREREHNERAPAIISNNENIDLSKVAELYRQTMAVKLQKLIGSAVVAPPRGWKDLETADKLMRRTLGMDESNGRRVSIVDLDVVNRRLQVGILEGEFIPYEETPATL